MPKLRTTQECAQCSLRTGRPAENDSLVVVWLVYLMSHCVREYVHVLEMHAVPRVARRGQRSLGAGVTGTFEQPNVVAGNQTWVVCKSSMGSHP